MNGACGRAPGPRERAPPQSLCSSGRGAARARLRGISGRAAVGGASRGRGLGPTRAAARPTAQERAKDQCRENAAVPSRAMLPWTVIGLALSLRLARSGAERGE